MYNQKGKRNLNVIIAGEGEQRSFLEKIIQENKIEKYIKLIGIHDDIIGIMKQSDIFVLPSRYEGLSIAMIEAMGCGLPIIASDAPGISDYIENGVNGLLFPVENHEILAEHIQLLASDKKLAKKLGKNSQNIFLNEYDMKKNIINLEKVIQKYHRI